jgi:hypothetical protein
MRTVWRWCVILLCTVGISAGGDVTLSLENGIDLLLHEDGTWSVDGDQRFKVDNTFTVTVPDGRIIAILPDYRWGYVDESQAEEINLKKVYATAKASHADVSEATRKAENMAIDRIARKLMKTFKDHKPTMKKLRECIRNNDKDIEKADAFSKSLGWKVDMKITLNKDDLVAVRDCLVEENQNKKKE